MGKSGLVSLSGLFSSQPVGHKVFIAMAVSRGWSGYPCHRAQASCATFRADIRIDAERVSRRQWETATQR